MEVIITRLYRAWPGLSGLHDHPRYRKYMAPGLTKARTKKENNYVYCGFLKFDCSKTVKDSLMRVFKQNKEIVKETKRGN